MTTPAKAPPDGTSLNPFDVFLSHNSQDSAVVERIAEKLRGEAIEPWLDKWCVTLGGDWQDELAMGLHSSRACAVFVGQHGVGDWERLELKVATDRMVKDRNFRVFLVLLPDLPEPFDPNTLPPFLNLRRWVDLRKGISDPRALQLLIYAIKGIAPGPEMPIEPRSDVCPYRGLPTFDEEHAEFFFGRDGDIQRLVEKLKTTRFLTVLGPSGIGKSSVARAGLIPAIRKGALPDSDTWTICVFTPGARPLTALAANLLRLYPHTAMGKTLDEMRTDQRSLHFSVSLALEDCPQNGRVVWIVDQFEEVFTLCEDETERTEFFANLLYAASIPGGRSMVVPTMRADFYEKCATYPELAAQISAHQFLVSPMSTESLRQVIEEPAWRVGLEFEPGLVETILEDVEGQPGALPLLEHALLELWQRRRGTMLTLEAYRESGKVKDAIAKRADTIYKSFGGKQQEIVRRVMLRLTQPGEDREDTRRRAMMSELITGPDEKEMVQSVVRTMADARLLITDSTADAPEQVVDVSHEALIRGWPRLRRWIEEDRQGLRIHRRLTEATLEWQRNQDESLLFRGARLAQTAEWRDRNEGLLNELEREFLDRSVELEKRERLAVQQRTRRIVAGLVTALALVSIALVYAFIQSGIAKERAERNRHLLYDVNISSAQSEVHERRFGQAQDLLDALLDPDLKNLRGFEWYYLWRLVHTDDATLTAHSFSVFSVAFSPDGKTLATGSVDKTVKLWDTATRKELATLTGHSGSVYSVAFSPDGKTLATGSWDSTVKLWDTATRKELATLTGHLGSVYSVAFSPDGKTLATGVDNTVKLWDTATRKELATLTGHSGSVYSVAFSPDGKTLATGVDNTVKLWDTATRKELATLTGHSNLVRSVAFSPDGKTLATGGDKTVKLWDTATRKELATLTGHSGSVCSVAFLPDGKTLATGSEDKTVKLWDTATRKELATLTGHSGSVCSVAFSPDGKTLATGSWDNTVKLWDTATRKELTTLTGHSGSVYSVAFSPDGKTLATGSKDEMVKLWDTATRKELATLTGHSNLVGSVAFSPDGKTLATGSEDKTVKLWDTATRKELATLTGHSGSVYSVAFSPDGKTLATGSWDKTVKLWFAATEDEVIARRKISG